MNLHSPRTPKPHRSDSIVPPTSGRGPMSRRRSSRMALNARVGLTGEDRQKCPFTMLPAKATNLNRNGGAVQVHRELLAGTTLVVRNQRGNTVTARVVAQLAALQGVPTYAIEFLEDEKARNFWGITFPTSNAE